MKTRSTATNAPTNAKQNCKTSTTNNPQTLSKTLILPSSASDDAHFVLLENPRTGSPSRYYFCPKLGLFEFTTIAPPPSNPRSILFSTSNINSDDETKEPGCNSGIPNGYSHSDTATAEELTQQGGFTSKLAQIFVATPVDITFFILPILIPPLGSKHARTLFQPLDDMIDARDDVSPSLRQILLDTKFRSNVERKLAAVCDTVEAGETMFRFSEGKFLNVLMIKAKRMVKKGLPPSLEDRFVRQALELPLQSVSREVTSTSKPEEPAEEKETGPSQNGVDSQTSGATISTDKPSSTASASGNASTPDTQATLDNSQAKSAPAPEMLHLLRIRTALSFIQSSYLSPQLSTKIEETLSSSESDTDFTPLTEHLKYIAKVRAEVLASRSIYDITRKRGLEEEDEASERSEQKRRKEEEEKKQKIKESRGVRDLKKINTSGMNKLSSFFGKAPAKKKS